MALMTATHRHLTFGRSRGLCPLHPWCFLWYRLFGFGFAMTRNRHLEKLKWLNFLNAKIAFSFRNVNISNQNPAYL